MITNGAEQFAGAVQDPTSVQLPDLATPGLADLPLDVPADLPVNLPALPALPAAPSLPGLGDLPIDLPVDLPSLPVDLPAMPALPSLPSVPGVDVVHDTVGSLTSQVPLVGDLTDGLDNHLPFGH